MLNPWNIREAPKRYAKLALPCSSFFGGRGGERERERERGKEKKERKKERKKREEEGRYKQSKSKRGNDSDHEADPGVCEYSGIKYLSRIILIVHFELQRRTHSMLFTASILSICFKEIDKAIPQDWRNQHEPRCISRHISYVHNEMAARGKYNKSPRRCAEKGKKRIHR